MSNTAKIQFPELGRNHAIYCHFDGQPDIAGRTLFKHYNNAEKVEELIALGGLLHLEKHISSDDDHSYVNQQKDVTVSYHRDLKEDLQFADFWTMADFTYTYNRDIGWTVTDQFGRHCNNSF